MPADTSGFWISDAVIRVSSLKLEWSYLPANNSTDDDIHALLHKQHPGGGYEDVFPLAHPFLPQDKSTVSFSCALPWRQIHPPLIIGDKNYPLDNDGYCS